MEKLPKIVTHPLGLAGYALALVFGLIGTLGPSNDISWLVPAAIALATVCIIGGLVLANGQVSKVRKSSPPVASTTGVTQHTQGDQSPAISGTSGDVSLSYENSKRK
jgi:hypothetical protein